MASGTADVLNYSRSLVVVCFNDKTLSSRLFYLLSRVAGMLRQVIQRLGCCRLVGFIDDATHGRICAHTLTTRRQISAHKKSDRSLEHYPFAEHFQAVHRSERQPY